MLEGDTFVPKFIHHEDKLFVIMNRDKVPRTFIELDAETRGREPLELAVPPTEFSRLVRTFALWEFKKLDPDVASVWQVTHVTTDHGDIDVSKIAEQDLQQIVGQQLLGFRAKKIEERFRDLFFANRG
jgi:hypothetical protein